MKEISKKTQILIGITLFSMFFGAGNLIFPPYLGLLSGKAVLPAFAGFALSAIGLPVLGVIAVARSGGLAVLAERVGKPFSDIFIMLIYLSIGPCLAIPRTASTSFELAVVPFVREGGTLTLLQIVYSAVFFSAALALALHPSKLVDWLGKRLAPVLLVLIAVLFFGCLVSGNQTVASASSLYQSAPVVQGFLDGYQTMDAIAALIFGLVLSVNIRAKGIETDELVMRTTVRAGWIAGALFLAVYGALTMIGVVHGAVQAENGAQLLSVVAQQLFGNAGRIILAAIFVIACFNTCIGLICCCGTYFNKLFPQFSYTVWAVIFAVVSAVISNAGLNLILKWSVPVLNCLYPVAITLIALAFMPQKLQCNRPFYQLPVALSGACGAVYALEQAGFVVPIVTILFAHLPLYSYGLGWLLPAVLGGIAGAVLGKNGTEET